MKLNDFHKHVSRKIYERGEEYYEDDMVDNVEHDYPDTWTAEVEGNDLYSVEIKLNGDEIVSWDCDCPYDYGDMCKHVVAVLLYIKDNRNEYPVTLEVSTKKGNAKVDYAKEIQKCFKHAYRSNDFSYEGQAIAYKLESYVKKAESLINLNCQEEAMTILLHLIREIGENYEEYDDYDGDLAGVCQNTAKLIAEMIETGLTDDLLKSLMDEIGLLIKNSNYSNYGLANLNGILFSISSKTANFDNAIHIIDEALKIEPDSFRTDSLVISKIKLLENAGRKEEIEDVVSSYLYLPEIRKIRLEELISKKQYEKALALIDEGINIAEKKKHPGTVTDWKDEKLSVYKSMGNKGKTIELAEDLFITGRESMKYYHILKTVIPTEKWAGYLDDFLCKSGKQKNGGLSGHVLAKIYIAEEYWDRLMDYVEKNIHLGKYNSLGEYEPYLEQRYPERMLAFYRSQITDYAAKNVGRGHYKYVSDVLKIMKKYPDGTETVNTLLAHFKSVYANRRAMMEELGK